MLIIDRKMPTCCEDCFAQQEYYNPRWDETEYNCGITYEKLGTHSRQDWGEWHCERPEWCPLKEQEAVLLENQHRPYGISTNANSPWISRCPRCGKKIEGKQTRFCKYCGQAVKWQ